MTDIKADTYMERDRQTHATQVETQKENRRLHRLMDEETDHENRVTLP